MNFTSLREAAKNKLTGFIGMNMPSRTKRLVCLASLGAHLKGTNSLDDETIAKLNSLMMLGCRDSALKLPVQLSKVIWNGCSCQIKLPPEEVLQPAQNIAQLAAKYFQMIPAWLRYDDDKIVYAEVETLIEKFSPAFAH